MDRLIVAIVHRADTDAVAEALRAGGHRFTFVPSVGGFLRAENATYLVGCDASAVDGILTAIEGAARQREVQVPLVLLGRLGDWKGSVVSHGAATVFVLEVERSAQL